LLAGWPEHRSPRSRLRQPPRHGLWWCWMRPTAATTRADA
jgi:hypothetical protein